MAEIDWMTQATFAELLALAQCLPGGMSTQMSFAIGTTRKGVLGGVLSGTLFQFPGSLFMSLAGAGAAGAASRAAYGSAMLSDA